MGQNSFVLNDNFGIGTDSPFYPLEISYSNITAPTNGLGGSIGILNTDISASSISSIIFRGYDAGSNGRHGAAIVWRKTGSWTSGGNNYGSSLSFATRADGSGDTTERLRITSDGNVGIGTSSSLVRLTVDSGSAGHYARFNSTAANGGYMTFESSGTVHGDIGTAAQLFSGGSASDFAINARGARNLSLGTNNTRWLNIDSSGLVNIENSSNSILAVLSTRNTSTGSSAANRFRIGNSDSVNAFTIDVNGSGHTTANQVAIYNQFSAPLLFGTSGTESFRINASNNIDVLGTTSLSFSSTTRQMINLWSTTYGIGVQSSTAYFRTGSGGAFAWFNGGIHNDAQFNAGSGGTLTMKLDSSGNLTTTAGILTQGANSPGSSYNAFGNWTLLTGSHGFYSTRPDSPAANSSAAHFFPNINAVSYGSWRVQGKRNGWQGLNFESGTNGNVTLMIHESSNYSGFHNETYGWQTMWYNGTFYVSKNAYGGGTQAVALDSSNYNSYTGLTYLGSFNLTGSSTTYNFGTSGFHILYLAIRQTARSTGDSRVWINGTTTGIVAYNTASASNVSQALEHWRFPRMD